MTSKELQNRTIEFAVRIYKMVPALPQSYYAKTIYSQLLRSASSIGANYRSACRAKSKADFINKIRIVEEEADETVYWIELLIRSELVNESKVSSLLNEAKEITAIFTSIGKTSKLNQRKS